MGRERQMKTLAICMLAILTAIAFAMPGVVLSGEDDWYGLPDDSGRDEVLAYCGSCHSAMLVAHQGMSRTEWTKALERMRENHEMEPLDDEDNVLVLDYLTRHLPPENRIRRLQERGVTCSLVCR